MGQALSLWGWGFSWGWGWPFTRRTIEKDIWAAYVVRASGQEAESLFRFPYRIDEASALVKRFRCDSLSSYSVLSADEPLRDELQKLVFGEGKLLHDALSSRERRALACFLGMALGDALGAPLEFSSLRYNEQTITGFSDSTQWQRPFNKFNLKPGQWTDDTSMGLCLAESLLVHPTFDPIDLRVRFLNWWHFGYRNAFGADDLRTSVGLGGCIGMSMTEFQ